MLSTLLLSLAPALAPAPVGGELVAVQAGTIHVVKDGRVIEGGTVLLSGGKIVAVGKDLEIPAGARVVDYGPSAVIVPGFVAADSSFGGRSSSQRTAEPGLAAVDGFDVYSSYASTLASGVTTVYVSPAPNRLIAGHGAVVKLGGAPGEGRVLNAVASVEGSISADARSTPGYWQPPVPATVDVGMGVERPQLPRTTMGAIIALRELLELAAHPRDSEEYGPYAGGELKQLLKAGAPWRMRAEETNEIRALLDFCSENGLPLVLRGAGKGASLAAEIAEAGFPVIVYSAARPNGAPIDRGKGEDAVWPDYTLAASLASKGVSVAIAPPAFSSTRDLRFHASLARAAGLSDEQALAAITLNAAEILGVADRVGSLEAGKDADLVVLAGDPMGASATVLATWVDGELSYSEQDGRGAGRGEGDGREAAGPVVLEVEQLFLGDGTVLEPGQLLMDGGKIREVGRRVSHPGGCLVVRGAAAMPGMIDTMGYLGLEGSTKTPKTDFKYARIMEPGDITDRRVARAGVTTVVMTPRGMSGSGVPAVAYKPAGVEVDEMVLADPAALHVQWSNPDRLKSGASVVSLLEKASEYKQKWDAYEAAMATWVPPPAEPEADAKGDDEDKDADADGDKQDSDDEADDDKKSKKKKKKKKKGEDDDPPFPVTGIWLAQATAEGVEPTRLRFQLLETDGTLEGYLRCDAVSDTLVAVHGERVEKDVTLEGRGSRGKVSLAAKTEKGKLVGSLTQGTLTLEFSAEQTSKEYPVAKRSERRKPKAEEKPKAPKGMPKSPGINAGLEPFKAAMEGRGSIVARVDRDDEILACVDAFEKHGIKPILYGANDAWKVSDEIAGRVAGVLLDHRVIYSDSRMGLRQRNRYAELANAGIPVAFHSSAEEGAVDLPLMAAYAVSQGMSPQGAIYSLTLGAARMLSIDERVGSLTAGHDADVLLLGGDPYDSLTSVQRVWVNGREVRLHHE